MKITIIGEIFYDEIYPFKGKKKTGFGGILYNLIALANIANSSTILYPVSYLWKKHFSKVKKICRPYPNINLSGLIPSKKGTETARLIYSSWDTRTEEILLYNPPIPFTHIRKFLNVDAIIINFTALRDISLATLKNIRQSSKALIMIDLHSFSSKINSKGIRYPHSVSNWKEWLSCADIVQGNEREIAALIGMNVSDEVGFKDISLIILESGVCILIITLGEKGVLISCIQKRKLVLNKIPTVPIRGIVDTTGSGDVFTAAFLWKYLNGFDSHKSAQFANKLAGINCTLVGLEELKHLRSSHNKI